MTARAANRRSAILIGAPALMLLVHWGCDADLAKRSVDLAVMDGTVDAGGSVDTANMDGTVDAGGPVDTATVDGTLDAVGPVDTVTVDGTLDAVGPVDTATVDGTLDTECPVGDAMPDSIEDAKQAVCDHSGSAPTVTVSTTQDLQSVINAASGLTVVWVDPGTYTCIEIRDKTFTRAAPLIIRKNPNLPGTALFNSDGCWETVHIVDSSYVVIDGVTVEGGGVGVYVKGSDHVILRDLTVHGQKQEGIHAGKVSSHVDILNCQIHDTGNGNPQYGEGIYIGTGNTSLPIDNTERVWIENNEVYDCGNGEGINVKAEVFHVTVRGNNIHHIAPGTASQYNQAALTVEASDRYLPSQPREVWVEDNTISHVSFGQWANGIMAGGTGVYVVRNTVTMYEERGIYVNAWKDLGLPCYVYDNNVDTSGQQAYHFGAGVDVRQSDPGSNPHSPQDWYCR